MASEQVNRRVWMASVALVAALPMAAQTTPTTPTTPTTSTAPAAPTSFSVERQVTLTSVLSSATPKLPANVVAALTANAMEYREQFNYNSTTGIVTETSFTVASGAPSMTPVATVPFSSFLSNYQLTVDKVSTTATAVQVAGTIYSNPGSSPFGNLAGTPAALSFGYKSTGTGTGTGTGTSTSSSTSATYSFTNVVTALADVAVVYSAAGSGTMTFPPPTTTPGTGTSPTVVISPATGNVSQKFLTLDGSKSTDPNGLTLSFAWAETGPAVAITGADTAMPTVQLVGGAGIYTFTLTVTNSKGVTATGSVSLTYNGR